MSNIRKITLTTYVHTDDVGELKTALHQWWCNSDIHQWGFNFEQAACDLTGDDLTGASETLDACSGFDGFVTGLLQLEKLGIVKRVSEPTDLVDTITSTLNKND